MSGSTALTLNRDESINLNADFGGGDLSTGAQKNIVAGGAVTIDGLSEDLAGQVLTAVKDAYTGATNFIQSAIGQNEKSAQKQVELVASSLKEAYSGEKSTLESLKSYAIYAVIGFIAWAYFRK